jgi:Protein of unknown function (DUF4446)
MSFATLQNAFLHWAPLLTGAAPYLALCAFVFSLMALVFIVLLERRLARLTGGKRASLEETLAVLNRDMQEMHAFRAELERYLKLAEARLRGAVSGVGVVRFNPFREGHGGNQSFAAALLDEHGTGVVISTLYARERVGVYAKPLEGGRSSFELTDEEREAVEKARTAIAGRKKL